MKPLRIDFLEDRRWVRVWGIAVLSACAVAGIAAAGLRGVKAATEAAQADAAGHAVQLIALRQGVPAATLPDASAIQAQAIRALLRHDWSPAFATVENLQLPGVQLVQMGLEGVPGSLRLEYELASISEAVALTAAINAGLSAPAWQLEGAAAAAAGQPGGALRATWSAQLASLR